MADIKIYAPVGPDGRFAIDFVDDIVDADGRYELCNGFEWVEVYVVKKPIEPTEALEGE